MRAFDRNIILQAFHAEDSAIEGHPLHGHAHVQQPFHRPYLCHRDASLSSHSGTEGAAVWLKHGQNSHHHGSRCRGAC